MILRIQNVCLKVYFPLQLGIHLTMLTLRWSFSAHGPTPSYLLKQRLFCFVGVSESSRREWDGLGGLMPLLWGAVCLEWSISGEAGLTLTPVL